MFPIRLKATLADLVLHSLLDPQTTGTGQKPIVSIMDS